jgi:hypothetical protein
MASTDEIPLDPEFFERNEEANELIPVAEGQTELFPEAVELPWEGEHPGRELAHGDWDVEAFDSMSRLLSRAAKDATITELLLAEAREKGKPLSQSTIDWIRRHLTEFEFAAVCWRDVERHHLIEQLCAEATRHQEELAKLAPGTLLGFTFNP